MKRRHWVILAILLLILTIIARESLGAFVANHGYYDAMMKNASSRGVIIKGFVFACIPLAYLVFSKKINGRHLLATFLFSNILFAFAHINLKGEILGSGGSLMIVISMMLIVGLMIYFLLALTARGAMINQKFKVLNDKKVTNILLIRGLGLAIFLLVTHYLILLNLLFPIVTRGLLLLSGWAIYKQKETLNGYGNTIASMFSDIYHKQLIKNPWGWVVILLCIFSLLYFFFGLQLSRIPYPTAWDANHAYMLVPRMFASHNGYFWSDGQYQTPFLRLSYITFWFSLVKPISSRFWISADSLAIMMNFLSGIFTLVLGLGAIKAALAWLQKKKEQSSYPLLLGRLILLLRLTSGMGAFLVFVDNKTDLGVMALTLMAALSGFVLLKKISLKEHVSGRKLPNLAYVAVSAFFFVLAIMSKPTAFIDTFMFASLMLGVGLGGLSILALVGLMVGLLAKAEILGIRIYVEAGHATPWFLSFLLLLPEPIRSWIKNSGDWKRKHLMMIKYVVAWGGLILLGLFVLKSPHILYNAFQSENPGSIEDIFKQYLMGKNLPNINPHSLMVTNSPVATLRENTAIAPQDCSLESLGLTSHEELSVGLREVQSEGLGEDLGRYVGYDQKTFSDPRTRSEGEQNAYGPMRLAFPLLTKLFPKIDHCYTTNLLARILCEKRREMNTRDASFLTSLGEQVKHKERQFDTIEKITKQLETKEILEQDIKQILTSYRKNRVLLNEGENISVPYRYLVPMNITYNRSLQNHSSYYTDIGFVRILLLLIMGVALIYAFLKRDKKMTMLMLTTRGGRVIWILIGSSILWYGMGLILRTAIASVVFFHKLWLDVQSNQIARLAYILIVFCFLSRSGLQLTMNFARIASQGSGGPFIYFKQNKGLTQEIVDEGGRITGKSVVKEPYTRQDVFDLQFGHYNPTIQYIKDRKKIDGILIAGTYLKYFLNSFENVLDDGMVSGLRKDMSDGNSCATALRLKDKKIKYFIIDPNIATVVMGDGNSSLFSRFLLKQDASGKRVDNGVLANLAQMYMDGYIKLVHTNNIGMKYAYAITSEQFAPYLTAVNETDEIALRTKIAGTRFFGNETGKLASIIGDIFVKRIPTGEAAQDVADVMGKIVDAQKIVRATQLQTANDPAFLEVFSSMTQDERSVFIQFHNIYRLYHTDPTELNKGLSSLIQTSLTMGSQILTFELTF